MIFKMDKAIVLIISIGIILTILILSIFPDRRNPTEQFQLDKCRWSRNMKEKAFSGVVIKKFKDESEHYFPTIMIDQIGEKSSIKIEFQNELSGFYNFVKEGDTLHKESDTLQIVVARNNNQRVNKTLSYGCQKNN